MDRLHALPDAGDFFDFSARRFVGTARRMIRTVPASEGLKQWDLWVAQALTAVAKLHDAGLLHGAIDPAALVINEDGNLRLGSLQKVREDTTPVTTNPFQPNNLLLPPEQNLYAAFKDAIPFQTAYQSLQQANWSMDQLATIFPTIQFTRPAMFGLYELIQSDPAYQGMQKAGDVWMVGFALLSVYYEWLEWPYAASAEFYQTRHEAFHDLVENMVRVLPADRITAVEALKQWAPQEVAAATNTIASTPSVTDETSDAGAAADVTVASPSSVSVIGGGSGDSGEPRRRRPYLALQSHPAGRSRTRRSPRN